MTLNKVFLRQQVKFALKNISLCLRDCAINLSKQKCLRSFELTGSNGCYESGRLRVVYREPINYLSNLRGDASWQVRKQLAGEKL